MAITDYPVAATDGIDPVIFRTQIIQRMALEYHKAMESSDEEFNWDDAMGAAMATWGTDWPDDPEPRTIEAALEAVSGDLDYWWEDRTCP